MTALGNLKVSTKMKTFDFKNELISGYVRYDPIVGIYILCNFSLNFFDRFGVYTKKCFGANHEKAKSNVTQYVMIIATSEELVGKDLDYVESLTNDWMFIYSSRFCCTERRMFIQCDAVKGMIKDNASQIREYLNLPMLEHFDVLMAEL